MDGVYLVIGDEFLYNGVEFFPDFGKSGIIIVFVAIGNNPIGVVSGLRYCISGLTQCFNRSLNNSDGGAWRFSPFVVCPREPDRSTREPIPARIPAPGGLRSVSGALEPAHLEELRISFRFLAISCAPPALPFRTLFSLG